MTVSSSSPLAGLALPRVAVITPYHDEAIV